MLKSAAAHLVQHHDERQAAAELIEDLDQQVRGIAPGIHHVPIVDGELQFVSDVEQPGLLHPLRQESVRLGREVHDDASFGLLRRGFDDAIEPFVAVDHHRRGEVPIEAKQRAVRLVGVEAEKRNLTVDIELGEYARDDGLADAALFPADEMKPGHVYWIPL